MRLREKTTEVKRHVENGQCHIKGKAESLVTYQFKETLGQLRRLCRASQPIAEGVSKRGLTLRLCGLELLGEDQVFSVQSSSKVGW